MSGFDIMPYPHDMVQEADLMLARTLRQWAENEVMSRRLEHGEDYEALLKPAMQTLFVELEMQKLIWPDECGGIGLNQAETARTLAPALEQIGRADTGIGFLFAVSFAVCASFLLDDHFNGELCRRIAPHLCRDDHIALATLALPRFTGENDAPDAPLSRGRIFPAQARLIGDNVSVTGINLRPLSAGEEVRLYAVLCACIGDRPEPGDPEPALVLIPADSPGLVRGEPYLKTGLAAAAGFPIDLHQVTVPVDNIAFKGEEPLRRMFSWFYLGLSATALGSLLAAYEILRDWGDTRVIKGKGNLFKENPLTASLMAEVSRQILVGRLLLYQLVRMFSSWEHYRRAGQEEHLYITALNVATEILAIGEKAINEAMELMGSAGYATEWNLERYWRDLKMLQLHLGSRELNNMETARFFYGAQTLQGRLG